MLTRDQQKLLGAAGSGMAAAALLDEMRERTTLEGGCSAPQPNCWISYNRKATWLEDHSGFGEAMKAAGTDKQAWRRIKPDIAAGPTGRGRVGWPGFRVTRSRNSTRRSRS